MQLVCNFNNMKNAKMTKDKKLLEYFSVLLLFVYMYSVYIANRISFEILRHYEEEFIDVLLLSVLQ